MDRRREEGPGSQSLQGEGIKHKDVKIPTRTKALDVVKRGFARKHRPERVNEEIDKFNDTLQKIYVELHADYLPRELKDKWKETTLFLMEDFQQYSDQAVRGYGNGSKGRQSRQEGDKIIKDLNEIIQNMSKDLPMWKHIGKFQARIKNDPSSVSNDAISNVEQLVADKVVNELKDAHKRVLDCYQQRLSDLPSTKMYLQDACKHLENRYNTFLSFMHLSDEWRQFHKVRAQFEAAHSENTEDNAQIKHLSNKSINRARDVYKEGLAWFQEADYGWPLRAEHFRNAAAKGAYKQLENAGKALETLSDALDKRKQIHKIQEIKDRFEFNLRIVKSQKETAQLPEIIKKKINETLISHTKEFMIHYLSKNVSSEAMMETIYDKISEIKQSLREWSLIDELYRNGSCTLQKQEGGLLSEDPNKPNKISEDLESHYSSIVRSYTEDLSIKNSDVASMEVIYNKIQNRGKELYRLRIIDELYENQYSVEVEERH